LPFSTSFPSKLRPASSPCINKHLDANVLVDGLGQGQVEFNQDVVSKIIESYTRESGVRNLEREIGSVCRAKAVEYAEAKDSGEIGRT